MAVANTAGHKNRLISKEKRYFLRHVDRKAEGKMLERYVIVILVEIRIIVHSTTECIIWAW